MHPTADQIPAPERFTTFATEARETSPLYAHLGDALAARPDAASILDEAPLAQRRATLLFAAVHDLLLTGREDGPLRAYYPSLGGARPPEGAATDAFLDVLARHRPAIVERLRTRATQTNEPGRAVAQRAAIGWLHALDPDPTRRVALVEVGASAGLLLHLDRYRSTLTPAELPAEPATDRPDVLLTTRLIGAQPPSALPTVSHRIGIDTSPLRVDDEDDRGWLRACVWPEHVERLARLDAALELARRVDDVDLVRGPMLDVLEPTVAGLPDEVYVVVLHSATLAYQTPSDREEFEVSLDRIAAHRTLWRVGLEGHFLEPFASDVAQRLGPPDPQAPSFLVAASRWTHGLREDVGLGRVQPHGAWLAFAPPALG